MVAEERDGAEVVVIEMLVPDGALVAEATESRVEDEPLYALSTLLDPRYKDRFFTSAESAKHGKDALAKKLDKDLKTTRDGEASDILEPPEKASRAEAAAPCRSTSSSSSFMKEFDKIREEREEPGGAASCSSTAVQMHGFFTEETIPVTHDPYKYWGVNRQRFPGLAVAALSYLCAPCTSVESERIFSTVSWILGRNAFFPMQEPASDAQD
ncbi:hypothetical protein E1301_Tti014515 [Triplophysa tibetana]|uniref:HAT C-terminal dimerisation domain-containing protein n=1 Tax=Triplophysa tibetana TaxID=1572043 RepID=A0A5A9PMJ4_9TELE|nr:hypothetical protein E1301_Tti014515 [Triplophysa tibetana]